MTKRIDVVGAVIVRDGLVFCVRRGPGGPDAGRWEFPGGKVEIGETPEMALVREIAEELGCVVAVGEKIESTPYERIELTTYYCTLTAAHAEPQLTEHVASRWLEARHLPDLDWAPADVPAVRRIVADAFTWRSGRPFNVPGPSHRASLRPHS